MNMMNGNNPYNQGKQKSWWNDTKALSKISGTTPYERLSYNATPTTNLYNEETFRKAGINLPTIRPETMPTLANTYTKMQVNRQQPEQQQDPMQKIGLRKLTFTPIEGVSSTANNVVRSLFGLQNQVNQINYDRRMNEQQFKADQSQLDRGMEHEIEKNKNALTENRDNALNNYYQGLIANQAEGNAIDRLRLEAGQQQQDDDSSLAMGRRLKVADDVLGGVDGYMNLSDEQRSAIKSRFIQTGELPNIAQAEEGGWFSSPKYNVSYGNDAQTQQVNSSMTASGDDNMTTTPQRIDFGTARNMLDRGELTVGDAQKMGVPTYEVIKDYGDSADVELLDGRVVRIDK